jgi:hypothetical protein
MISFPMVKYHGSGPMTRIFKRPKILDQTLGFEFVFLIISGLKIKRPFGLFDGFVFNCMAINHGSSDIAVTQQFQDRANIIVGLQQVAGKTVPESMGDCAFRDFSPPYGPFDCFLDMGLMGIISSVFVFVRNECQRLCRKKPLPASSLAAFLYFFSILFGRNAPAYPDLRSS